MRHVNLPTNGLLPAKLESVVGRLLQDCPELTIDLNFSLDGLANTHDAIRGVPNNFEKTLATIHLAERLWAGNRRVRRNVVSCITAENYKELVELGLKMLAETDSDGQYFEIIRGNPLDPELKKIPIEDLEQLHRKLMSFHEHYADKLYAHLIARDARLRQGVLSRQHQAAFRHSPAQPLHATKRGRWNVRPGRPPS